MYSIETASGRAHSVDMCGAADGFLHIVILDGASFAAVVREFGNPENTGRIVYRFGEMETTHEGYTVLTNVKWESGKRYHIILQKQE